MYMLCILYLGFQRWILNIFTLAALLIVFGVQMILTFILIVENKNHIQAVSFWYEFETEDKFGPYFSKNEAGRRRTKDEAGKQLE